jgi:hypothetical protein
MIVPLRAARFPSKIPPFVIHGGRFFYEINTHLPSDLDVYSSRANGGGAVVRVGGLATSTVLK